jgi:hypothetical protein
LRISAWQADAAGTPWRFHSNGAVVTALTAQPAAITDLRSSRSMRRRF